MTKEKFDVLYAQWEDMCKKTGNIKPLIALVHELAGKMTEGDKSALIYVNKVQRDLYEKGILPYMVQNTHDWLKVDKLPLGDIRDFLNYVCLTYRREEEDWHWDEELQQYVSRNSLWPRAKK